MAIKVILKQAYAKRREQNPSYSQRDFAKDLGVSQTSVSEIFSGKRGLSPERAQLIAKALGYEGRRRKEFCALASMEFARSRRGKHLAKEDLKRNYHKVSSDAFSVIADWRHYAILELMKTRGFVDNPSYIAGKLGISEEDAAASVERLKSVELLSERGGEYEAAEGNTEVLTKTPSTAMRQHHRKLVERSNELMETIDLRNRENRSLIKAVKKSDVPEAKQMIEEFFKEFDTRFRSEEADEVYALSTQFFPLS